MKSTICIAEDRESCEPCLKLLLLSLQSHSPETLINLCYPVAKEAFVSWIRKYPRVRLRTAPLKSGYGWNVKPQAIMQLLDQGFDEVIWIDSDVIVKRNLLPLFSNLSNDSVAATENTLEDGRYDRNGVRARLWGLPVGRTLPFSLNSGVLRVTKENYQLMERWWALLQSDKYQKAQQTPWQQRPIHMLGDQDVLTALLTSQEFSRVPIRILRRGKDIIQFDGIYGYTIAERMRNVIGDGPAFVHSVAGKPWSEQWKQGSTHVLREYIKSVYLDLSPYTLSAIRFKDELDCRTEWMEPHYVLSRILRALGMQYMPLVGLPMAIFADLARLARYLLNSLRSNISRLETDGLQSSDKQ